MGLITDLFFGFGNLCIWTFKNILEPIGYVFDWILFAIGLVMIGWWLYKLNQFGNKNEKDYEGW